MQNFIMTLCRCRRSYAITVFKQVNIINIASFTDEKSKVLNNKA